MTSTLPVQHIASGSGLALRPETWERINEIFDEKTPENTKRAYNADLRFFWSWAKFTFGLVPTYPVPVNLIIEFITDQVKGMAPHVEQAMIDKGTKAKTGIENIRTLKRRIATLSTVHQLMHLENPCKDVAVVELLKKSIKDPPPVKKKTAIPLDILHPILATCRTDVLDNLRDMRDAAILYFAFSSGGRRRSEVAEAVYENLAVETYRENGIEKEGFVYVLGKTKTTSADKPHVVPIKGQAAVALARWLNVSGIRKGRIFRSIRKGGKQMGESISDKAINHIVKKRCALIGLSPDDFGAHSLRSGFITQAARDNINIFDTIKLSCHRSVEIALEYYQAQEALRNPAADLAG